MSAAALEIRGLRRSFRHFTLGPIDMTVPTGAIYGFVGPNGAGKTTTFDLIFGIGATQAGTITALGLDHLKDEVAMKRQVGYVSPGTNFGAWIRVRSLIRFVRGFYPTWDEKYFEHLVSEFDLDLRANIRTLSFGSRTKLALILAMAWRPKLLVLDEPTVGVDAITKRQIFHELLALVKDGDRTVLISSHNLDDLERVTDHIGLIRNGQMLVEGATADVVDRYRLVDFTMPPGVTLDGEPGVVVQERDRTRWRVLIDQRVASLDRLALRGAQPINDAPVSLEDLFVALGRD